MPKGVKEKLSQVDRENLYDAIHELSGAIQEAKAGTDTARELIPFVSASLTQTDNIRPRQTRLRFLYSKAFA